MQGLFSGARGRGGTRLAVLTVLVSMLAAGCASYYDRKTDAEVYSLMKDVQARVEASRAKETPEGVITPKPEGPQISSGVTAKLENQGAEVLSLRQALATAFASSYDFKLQKESLYLSFLGYTSSLRTYNWLPGGQISSKRSTTGASGAAPTTSVDSDLTASLTRTLLNGGVFGVSGSLRQTGNIENAEDSNSSRGSVSYSQPLLEGAGEAAREGYIQLQLGMLNTARGFETFRQDLVIRTLTRYYGIVRQKKSIENAKARLNSATFFYDRAQALFDKGKQSQVDVLRIEQDKLQAENSLSDAIESYNLAIDRFRLDLGLPDTKVIDVSNDPIEPEIIKVNLDEAMKTAFGNRFDVMQAKENLDTAERSVRIARNKLLPTLNLATQAGIGSEPGKDMWDYSLDKGASGSASLTLAIPVDSKPDRDHYKTAVIRLTQQRRSYEQFEDGVRVNIRNAVRALRQAEVSLVIQKKSVESAGKQREVTQLQFEKGTKSSRDIVDAEQALQNARDAYIQAQVDYVVASIQLRKELGTLRVDEQGGWH